MAPKLEALRVKFEKRTPSSARYRLHRLSSEAAIPCLTSGDPCASCIDNLQRAQREVLYQFLSSGRAYVLDEMQDAIASWQVVYKRQKRLFTDSIEVRWDVSRHNVG